VGADWLDDDSSVGPELIFTARADTVPGESGRDDWAIDCVCPLAERQRHRRAQAKDTGDTLFIEDHLLRTAY